MPHAKLTLRIPDSVWIGEIARSHPDARFRILAALSDEDAGVGLTEVSAPDLAAVLAAMRSAEEVVEFDILQAEEDSALVQFETTTPLLLLPVHGSGVPLEMPFVIQDGEATWEITAPQDRLSALGDQLDQFGIDFDVEWIQQHVHSEQLLTERQRRLVSTAVELGYYDTPRRCSLTELADEVGIAKSTCSETLHRAEGKIVKRFLDTDAAEDRARTAD